jgi:hypothetical protein
MAGYQGIVHDKVEYIGSKEYLIYVPLLSNFCNARGSISRLVTRQDEVPPARKDGEF